MNFKKDKNSNSEYRYLSLTVNYDTAMIIVSGNIIRSKGVDRGTGLYFDAPETTNMQVMSYGNLIEGVVTKRFVGENVNSNPSSLDIDFSAVQRQ